MVTVNNNCGECKHFNQKTECKGQCMLSKTGAIRARSAYACKRFEKGTFNPEDYTAERNLQKIMDTIAKCYKGGRFG